MEEKDKIRYETLFYCQKLEEGFMSGDAAKALFIKSKLPLPDLTKIWRLADITCDNKLDVHEFSVAMHLIELKFIGEEIPIPLEVTAFSNSEDVVDIPKMSSNDMQQIQKIFDSMDSNAEGLLGKDVVKPVMTLSGFLPQTLARIWYIADLDRDGKLCPIEFTIALHLIKQCVSGVALHGPVNPFALFPDQEDIKRLCKDKLAVFEREFLMEEKNKKDEADFFLPTSDSDDFSLDLLNEYLFGHQINAARKGEHVAGPSADEGNASLKVDGSTLEEESSVSGWKREPTTQSRSTNCSETIERSELDRSEATVDLESVFETFGDDSNEEFEVFPVYVAKTSINYEKTEEEENLDDFSTFQRRTYFDKELVFEDPIGSEIIGDVEVEVDLEDIICDIEKEIIDEERRLPIARVLPIYKSPPVSNVMLLEEALDIKESNETISNRPAEKENLNGHTSSLVLNINNEITTTNAKANNSDAALTLMTADVKLKVDSPKDEGKSAVNLANAKDSQKDMAEQRRLLRQEEQRKLREQLFREEMREEQPILLTRLPNSDIVKLNDGVQDEGKVIEPNESVEVKHGRLLVENSKITEEISRTEKERPSFKSNVVDVLENEEVETYDEDEREVKSDDEEKQNKLREAEEKEKILLERIKFLEQKRQQLYERNQQKLNFKNFAFGGKNESSLSLGNDVPVGEISVIQERNANVVDSKILSLNSGDLEEINKPCIKSPQAIDVWSGSVSAQQKESEASEKKKIAEALEAKKKREAELERQREEILREAEKRRMEEEEKEREEQVAAENRKRTFLENLRKLKQRVINEEEEKSKATSKNQAKHTSSVRTADAIVAGKLNSSFAPPTSRDMSHGNVSASFRGKNTLAEDTADKLQQTQNINGEEQEIREKKNSSSKTWEAANSEMQNNQTNDDEMRQENFKMNREIFEKRVQTEVRKGQERKKAHEKKVRPKSFYGGMFNKATHPIIGDSLLAQHEALESASVGDFVDEEAFEQFKREQELKNERERVKKLRHSLERETSYTVENVEEVWEADTQREIQKEHGWDSLEKKQTRPLSEPRRRSLVNTLATEWNSFIDVLEENKRRESETIKMRQKISAERRVAPARVSVPSVVHRRMDIVEKDRSTRNDVKEMSVEENEADVLRKRTGKVKTLIKSYKRLSLPASFYHRDAGWNHGNTDGEIQTNHTEDRSQGDIKSNRQRVLSSDGKYDQKRIIKENAPKRKTDLAQAWTNRILNQQNMD